MIAQWVFMFALSRKQNLFIMNSLKRLYQSLSERKRPEDIADLILEVLNGKLTAQETKVLKQAANGALKNKLWQYTSMLQEFAKPIGAEKQVKKAIELFGLNDIAAFDYASPDLVERFIVNVSSLINKAPGANDFRKDRLNKAEREALGMDVSKRMYNKQWRLLKRLEEKTLRLAREIKKSEFQQMAKNGLARQISESDFYKDVDTACFIAYYTAKSNIRSIFTNGKQERAFDTISAMLFLRCTGINKTRKPIFDRLMGRRNLNPRKLSKTANWWAIAHVYPNVAVLAHLSDAQKGVLLGKWTLILQDIAELLGELWASNSINRQTMIVKRGNDSTTWNHTAGAWNKARDHWMNLIYATGTEFILEELCFGKVLRLMAADVAYWHSATGGDLDPNTYVWNQLPLPWEVFEGTAICTKEMVIQACSKVRLNPETSGWIAPRKHSVVAFKPTPELVHGVTIANPFLATILKKNKVFSGKAFKQQF